MSHTPGPWFYVRLDEWSHRIATKHGTLPDGDPNYWTVADINKQREPEHEANARLIAAAPMLLEALSAMLTHMGMDEDEYNRVTFNQARAAIKEAKGEQ